MLEETNIPKDFLVLRDRQHKGEESAIIATNRAGTVQNGNQVEAKDLIDKKQAYPAYHVQIDWNGDMVICFTTGKNIIQWVMLCNQFF